MKKPVEDKGIIFYEGSDNGLRIKTFIEDDTIWLTQPQIAELFQSSRSNVAEYIKHIYEEEELRMDATCRNFRQVQIEDEYGVSRDVLYYFNCAVKDLTKEVKRIQGGNNEA